MPLRVVLPIKFSMDTSVFALKVLNGMEICVFLLLLPVLGVRLTTHRLRHVIVLQVATGIASNVFPALLLEFGTQSENASALQDITGADLPALKFNVLLPRFGIPRLLPVNVLQD